MRSSAPIRGGPKGSAPAGAVFVKPLDEFALVIYRQVTLPPTPRSCKTMAATSTREEIRIGELAIRFLLEGDQSAGSVAVFEFDVPAGSKVPAPHSHDAYEETIYGLEG